MSEDTKPRLVGINHIALEVGDVQEALAFYRRIFSFELRGQGEGQAFIDIGDQFIALMESGSPHSDKQRHFGLVVDDRSHVRELARAAGATMLEGDFLDFLDLWGNGSRWSSIAIFNTPKRADCDRDSCSMRMNLPAILNP
jgi:catechol 2,3-dioxygenase-like lactoylglutathione lyase family enzyme